MTYGRTIPLPRSSAIEVWIDFDGTITQSDVLDEIIQRFAINNDWKRLEWQWQRGEIGSMECLAGQLGAVRVSPQQLDELIGGVRLDPGCVRLFDLLGGCKVPVTIVSDGLDFIIRSVLLRHKVTLPVIRCNSAILDDGTFILSYPHKSHSCRSAAAHCKCDSIETLRCGEKRAIYIGDGRSDLCPARSAHVRFAKGVLATRLQAEGLPYFQFTTLNDVADLLIDAWSGGMGEAA